VNDSLKATQYAIKKDLLLEQLSHVSGDTYTAKDMATVKAQFLELGYRVAETSADGKSIRFEPETGEKAPLDPAARPMRVSEDLAPATDPVKLDTAAENWKGCKDQIAQGIVPPRTDLPKGQGNDIGIHKLNEINADTTIPDGVRAEFYRELANNLDAKTPPESIFVILRKMIVSDAARPEPKFINKGTPLAKGVAEKFQYFERAMSVKGCTENKIWTDAFYQKVRSAAPEANLPAKLADLPIERAQEFADLIINHGIPIDPMGDVNAGALVQGYKGSPAFWNPKGAADTSSPKALKESLAVTPDYVQGAILFRLNADQVTGAAPVNAKADGTPVTAVARRPTALDGMGGQWWKLNPNLDETFGMTAPDLSDPGTTVKATPEVVLPPVQAGKTIRTLVR
jgi:hypothetical protein